MTIATSTGVPHNVHPASPVSTPVFLTYEKAREIAKRCGTPVFVYDMEAVLRQATEALEFPNAYGLTVRYAMKACPNGAITRLFNRAGIHIDASSAWEAKRAMDAGIPAGHIQLTAQECPPTRREREERIRNGVNPEKIPPVFEDLIEAGVLFNACSLNQLEVYGQLFPGTEVSTRVNPGLGSGGTKRTNVGGPSSSFGIWHEYLDKVEDIAARHSLDITRIHSHIGSGSDPKVWQHCARLTLRIAVRFQAVNTVNLGGGFKIARMPEEDATDLQVVGQPIAEEFVQFYRDHGRKLKLEIEPGTFFVANAGALVASVHDITDTGETGFNFIKINAGMTEVTRPTLYGAQHRISVVPAVNEPRGAKEYVVVGHCCESGDILTPAPGDPEELKPRRLIEAKIGDILVIDGSGAYCAGMSVKHYNSFPDVASYLLTPDGHLHCIEKDEAGSAVYAGEQMPELPDLADYGRTLGSQLGL